MHGSIQIFRVPKTETILTSRGKLRHSNQCISSPLSKDDKLMPFVISHMTLACNKNTGPTVTITLASFPTIYLFALASFKNERRKTSPAVKVVCVLSVFCRA